jgi:quinol-cytochrome oxidoreductase complex cytochrome b subunit
MKLPSPPLPRSLKRTPPRPGSKAAGSLGAEGDRGPATGASSNGHGNGNGNGQLKGKVPGGTKPRKKAVDRQALKEQAVEVPISVVGWLDERSGISPFARAMLYRKVPKGTNWFYTLGSATLFAFVSQAVTGVFLAMYYNPAPTQAYESIVYISNDLFLGQFVRGMHRWGATVMVVLIFLHMARTFFFGAYKYPRELNWVIGVVTLVLTLAMALTGYLLPFDQRGYWATIVAVNINASAPILGPYLADFLRGGAEFGATTLSRFYSIHMLLIPGLLAVLIGAHLYLVAKLGTTAPPWLKAEQRRELAQEEI